MAVEGILTRRGGAGSSGVARAIDGWTPQAFNDDGFSVHSSTTRNPVCNDLDLWR
jgi:hypothetical protein